MAQEFAKKFYNSKQWIKCRKAYYIKVHGLCEKCGAAGDIVHHKEKLTQRNINNPEVTLNESNLELLCIECHNSEHGQSVTAKGLMFDENGNLVKR